MDRVLWIMWCVSIIDTVEGFSKFSPYALVSDSPITNKVLARGTWNPLAIGSLPSIGGSRHEHFLDPILRLCVVHCKGGQTHSYNRPNRHRTAEICSRVYV